jgi:hypothetical protein
MNPADSCRKLRLLARNDGQVGGADYSCLVAHLRGHNNHLGLGLEIRKNFSPLLSTALMKRSGEKSFSAR